MCVIRSQNDFDMCMIRSQNKLAIQIPVRHPVKVHITPLTKFRPETPYGVKT